MSSKRLAGGVGAVIACCVALVAHFEGKVPQTYVDPVGVPTFCYGHTGDDVHPGRKAADGECEALLYGDLAQAYAAVLRCVHKPLTTHQAAALTSFTYNVGEGNFCRSTMARQINAGEPPEVWCAQLTRWVYAGGKQLPGLVKRRAAEKRMCLGEIDEFAND